MNLIGVAIRSHLNFIANGQVIAKTIFRLTARKIVVMVDANGDRRSCRSSISRRSKIKRIAVIALTTLIPALVAAGKLSASQSAEVNAGAFKPLYGQEGLDQEHREWVEAIKKKLEAK